MDGNKENNLSRPLKPEKKSLMVFGRIILALVLLGTGGFFIFQNRQLKENPLKEIAEVTIAPSPEIKPTEPENPPAKEKLTASFQEILAQNCQKISLGPGAYFYGIAPSMLPIAINSSTSLKYRGENTLACAGDPAILNSQYITMETTDGISANLYNRDSKEGGHGGYPFLGSLPNQIGEKNGISFSISLNWPDGGCASPEYLAVKIRGVKNLKLTNGETVFINTLATAVKEGDPNLMTILNKNLQTCEIDPGRKEVRGEGIEEEIKKAYFSDLNNLAPNENQIIEKISAFLNSISPK